MNLNEIFEIIPETDAIKFDGFDSAIIGIGQRFNADVFIYDYQKCIEILQESMTIEEAIEYFEYNMIGAYLGENTPIFLYHTIESE